MINCNPERPRALFDSLRMPHAASQQDVHDLWRHVLRVRVPVSPIAYVQNARIVPCFL